MDETREKEITELQESIDGYKEQHGLIKRKREAMLKAKELVKDGIERIEPVFRYQQDPEYWDVERELYDIKIGEDAYELSKQLTTLQDVIEQNEERLRRMKGEDNE